MRRFKAEVLVVVLVACAVARAHGAATAAAVSGTVRDLHGTPQMGALIELLSPDASVIGSALSDGHGRYIIPTVTPGRYELRATAAFLHRCCGRTCDCKLGRSRS